MKFFNLIIFSFVLIIDQQVHAQKFSSDRFREISERLKKAEAKLKNIGPGSNSSNDGNKSALPKPSVSVEKLPDSTPSNFVEKSSKSYDRTSQNVNSRFLEIAERLEAAESKLKSVTQPEKKLTSKQLQTLTPSNESLPKVEIPKAPVGLSNKSEQINARYMEIYNRIQGAEAKLQTVQGEGIPNPVFEGVNDSSDEIMNTSSFPDFLNEEQFSKDELTPDQKLEDPTDFSVENQSWVNEFEFENSQRTTPHEVGFGMNFILPFESDFKHSWGTSFPIKYSEGMEVEFDYLYNFDKFALGTSFSFASSRHESLGPLPHLGSIELGGQSRSLGGGLLARFSKKLTERFGLEGSLILGLAKRKDEFYIDTEYLRESGTVFKYALGLGTIYDLNEDYKLGFYGKYQRTAGLQHTAGSNNILVGMSAYRRF